jgi:hypothetical protein
LAIPTITRITTPLAARDDVHHPDGQGSLEGEQRDAHEQAARAPLEQVPDRRCRVAADGDHGTTRRLPMTAAPSITPSWWWRRD